MTKCYQNQHHLYCRLLCPYRNLRWITILIQYRTTQNYTETAHYFYYKIQYRTITTRQNKDENNKSNDDNQEEEFQIENNEMPDEPKKSENDR